MSARASIPVFTRIKFDIEHFYFGKVLHEENLKLKTIEGCCYRGYICTRWWHVIHKSRHPAYVSQWWSATGVQALTCELCIHCSTRTPVWNARMHTHTHDVRALSPKYGNKLLATWTHPSSDADAAVTSLEVWSVTSGGSASANITSMRINL